MKRLTVNLVSESAFTVQGHGVHTAFLEMAEILRGRDDVRLLINDKPKKSTNITHIHTFGFFALKRLLSRKGGKKVVSAHVVPDSLVGSLKGASWWAPIFKYYLKWFYNRADVVVAVSPYTRGELIRMGIKRPIEMIPNSVDIKSMQSTVKERHEIRASLGIPDDMFIVIGSGQVQPRKRFDEFVKIATELPDVQFIWIGGIPFKAAGADSVHLTKMMREAPTNVMVTDVIPNDEARRYTKIGNLMFMPSEQETFGLSIIEGAAAGMPVLVRDIHDYDATFGDLVTRGDDKTFLKQIKLFHTDKDFYADGVKKSAALAAKYDSKVIGQQLMNLYWSLVKK